MQTIKRKDLKILHDAVCSNWQATIKEIVMDQIDNTLISIDELLIEKALKEANAKQSKLILTYFKQPEKISDKIKTFADIWKISGNEGNIDFLPWMGSKPSPIKKAQTAFAKLQLIASVYNDGSKEVAIYFPMFNTCEVFDYVEEVGEFDDMSEIFVPDSVLFVRGEDAKDAGNKFKNIYKDYLL